MSAFAKEMDKVDNDARILSRSPSPSVYNNPTHLINICFNDVSPHHATEIRQVVTSNSLISTTAGSGVDTLAAEASRISTTPSNNNNNAVLPVPPGFSRIIDSEVGEASVRGTEELCANGDATAKAVGEGASTDGNVHLETPSVGSESVTEQLSSSEADSSGNDSESSSASTVIPTVEVASNAASLKNRGGLRNMFVYNRGESSDEHLLSQDGTKSGGTTPLRNASSVEKLYRQKQKGKPTKVTKGNRRTIDNIEYLFDVKNETNYKLKTFRGRKASFINNYGYTHVNNGVFKPFYDLDQERLNFLRSFLGQIASEINNDGSYFCFGVSSYILVKKCKKCNSDKSCKKDHHLQSILDDIVKNSAPNTVTIDDLNLDRRFENVAFVPPVADLDRSLSDILYVPSRNEWASNAFFTLVIKGSAWFNQVNKKLFPQGEIVGNIKDGFNFFETNTTHSDSVIRSIIYSQSNHRDPILSLNNFLENEEPKIIESDGNVYQSLPQSVYAIYCHFITIRSMRKSNLDILFKNPFLQEVREADFGLVKESVLPVGVVYAHCRLATERKIIDNLYRVIHSPEHRHLLGSDASGTPFLRSHPLDGVIGIIKSSIFPPISECNKSILGYFYYSIAQVFAENANYISSNIVSEHFLARIIEQAESNEKMYRMERGAELGLSTTNSAEEQILKMFQGDVGYGPRDSHCDKLDYLDTSPLSSNNGRNGQGNTDKFIENQDLVDEIDPNVPFVRGDSANALSARVRPIQFEPITVYQDPCSPEQPWSLVGRRGKSKRKPLAERSSLTRSNPRNKRLGSAMRQKGILRNRSVVRDDFAGGSPVVDEPRGFRSTRGSGRRNSARGVGARKRLDVDWDTLDVTLTRLLGGRRS